METDNLAGTLTEEHFREWLREAFTTTDQQVFARGLADSGLRLTATEVLFREREKQRESSSLIPKQRALKLLRRFITSSQWQDYKSLGCFSQKDSKGRIWKFKNQSHYPIECDGQPICIDPERGAPNEDLLLQVWLEVIGGRGVDILPDHSLAGFHFNVIIMDDVFTAPQRHGILCGIT